MVSQSIYQLRDYQSALVQKVFAEWQQGNRRVMMQLPTGGGKTQCFSALAREFTIKNERVLVLAHREELLTQAQEKLESVTGMPVGIIKARYPANPLFPVQVASVQSLTRRKELPDAALVIVDEAHHSCSKSYTKIFEHYRQSYILGVTATPMRIDGQGFKFLYDSLVLGPSTAELIKNGYLCSYKLYASPTPIKTAGIKTKGGDYDLKQLEVIAGSNRVMGEVVDTWKKEAFGKQTIVFAVSVSHSKAIAEAYKDAGVPAAHIDGETPPSDRRAILELFRTGKILVLTNCAIVTEGFDVPECEVVQCVRPTKSLSLYLQIVGRGLRPAPNKEYLTILDHTENWWTHGLPDADRNWSLDPISLDPDAWTVACPECHHVFRPLPHEQEPYWVEWVPSESDFKRWFRYTCPSCQVVFAVEKWNTFGEPPPPRSLEHLKDEELYEIPRDCRLEILGAIFRALHVTTKKKFKKHTIVPEYLLHHVILKQYPNIGFPEIREFAKLLNLPPTWADLNWSKLLADKLRQFQTWSEVVSLMSGNQQYKRQVWRLLTQNERDKMWLLKDREHNDTVLTAKELEVLWHRVLENIEPLSNRELVRYFCVLLAFDECVAVIGTKSQTWEKHLRDRLPEIRAAFQQTCQKSVEVQLRSTTS